MKAKDQALQKASRYGAFIATDQEGGTVSRLSTYPGLTNNRKFPAPWTVYKQKGMAGVVTEYSAVAKIMHGLGINWNFAPVADVTTDQGSFIYPRTLGENYQITANYVKQVVPAIQKQKVGATLKHFPGYGAAADTHVGFASDNRSLDVFRQNDFLPFVAGIKAGADSLLVGHVVMKSVDGSKPASLSRPVHDLVRKELKFKGVIVTDDMNMGAVTKFAQEKKINADVLAVMAGNDMLLSSDYKTQTVNFNRYAVYDKVTHELLGYASSDQVNGNALITTDGYIHDTDPNSVAGYVADDNFAEVDNYDLSKYGYTGPTDEQHQKMAQVASAAADVNKAQTIVNVYYQHATTNTENDKTITRTINVHKPTGQTEQVLQNADFHVVSVIDKVTGATVSTTVTTPDGKTDTWAQYSPMTIPGYGIQIEDTTDQNNKFALDSINQKTVAITDHNVVIDVNYLAQAQNVTVKYVDDDEGGKQVGTTTTLNGATDTTDTISVKVPENYVYNNRIDLDGKQVASNMAYTYTFQPGTHEVVIHLGHKIETSQETQSIKASQTVTYQGAGQQTPEPNVTSKDLDFTRTAKMDMVTNEKTYSAWTGNDYTFNKIISPNVRGYQPDMGVVGGAQVTLSELNSASPEQMAEYLKNGINFDYVVTYHANQQTVKVVYLDEDNNNEIVRYGNDINSSFGENVTVVPSLIANEEGKYYLKSTDPINHVVSDKDEDNVITIYLKHKHVQNTETSAPTRTINVHMPDGKVETTVQQLNFSRSVDTDLVTNAKTYSNWTITDEGTNADQANSSWNAFTAPELTGYQADTKAVQSKVIAHDTPNEIVDIHYQAEDRTVNVKYADDDKLDADGNPTELPELTGTLTGKYDEYTTITPTIPENYQFKKVDNNPNLTQADQGYSYHFLVDGDTVVIHLGHEHMDVERSQTATQTIHYVDQDGNTIHPDQSQTLTFKQKGDKDLVTGEIVWDPAYQETLNFDKVASPAISGYQNPNPALVPGSGLTLNDGNFTADHNSEVTVVYEKVTEPATQTPGDNQPAEPNKNGNLTPDAPAATGKNTNNTARETENKDRKLPQTGDNEDDFAYAGFFSMILGLLGLGFLKKRD